MKSVAIIGAGISGLFIANLFKRNPNYQITIYEKNTSIALEEGYGVQLSVNSIKLLNEIGFEKLQNNEKFTPEKMFNCVAASDAFFPFPDGVEELVQAGVTAIIQPGGSINYKEIIRVANKAVIAMIFS